MTLKTRNRFIKIFMLLSLFVCFSMLLTFILSIFLNTLVIPPDLRFPLFLSKIPFLPNNFFAVMLSLTLLICYVPACFFILIRFFENTQTSEIIYFTGFLIACMSECARFITICLGLWQSFSNILIFMGNIVFFGRTLAPLSFLCAAILSETKQRQDIEKNYIIMIASALVFSAVIPMNTAKISSTGLVTEGFMSLINIFRFLLFVTAIASFYISGIKKNSREHKQLSFSVCLILTGYSFIVLCDNFVFLISGAFALFYGTYSYLKYIHKIYMWG